MLMFRVPREEPAPKLQALVDRALFGAGAEAVEALFASDRVRLDDRLCRDPSRTAEVDALISVRLGAQGLQAEESGAGEDFGFPQAEELGRAEGWVVVDKPVGMPGRLRPDDPMHPLFFLADALGLDRDTFRPVWPMPRSMGGPWLCATSAQEARRLQEMLQQGALRSIWIALIPRPARPQGRLELHGTILDYATTRQQGGLAEVQLQARFGPGPDGEPFDPVAQILDALASSGHAALGDGLRGGYMVDGGLRLRLGVLHDHDMESFALSWPAPQQGRWWPEQPVTPLVEEPQAPREAFEEEDHSSTTGGPAAGRGRIESLQVSTATLQVMRKRGHPWVLADRKTGPLEGLEAGDLVQLVGESGQRGPFVLMEGADREPLARLWSWHEDEAQSFGEEVDLRLDEAVARRQELVRGSDRTDLYRLIHGQADGLPGLYLDRVGPLLRAVRVGRSSDAFFDRICRGVLDADPRELILVVDHLQDVRRGESLPQARPLQGRQAPYLAHGQRVIGREDGLRFWCEPWEGIDVGFFADQRSNRRRLRQLASSGERWLNLFCHTGSFSVVLASLGARVTSVDLSRRYLDWLEENLALNGLDPAPHQSVADDARRALEEIEGPFDGIIVDPPTAASGDQGFWSVRRDLPGLLAGCLKLLRPGGVLLVCHNDRKLRGKLDEAIDEAATSAGVEVPRREPAPPGPDYPPMPGFPEGDPFEGRWVWRAG